MPNSIFYCEVVEEPQHDYWEFAPGIYAIPDRLEYNTKISRCLSYSKRVWIQGPRGKVRLREDGYDVFRYVTNNEKLMQEFMWVKLKAQPLKHYT